MGGEKADINLRRDMRQFRRQLQFFSRKTSLQQLSSLGNGEEFSGPVMKTTVPGPKSLELLGAMDKIQETRTVHMFVDYQKSQGNYVVDVDGNQLLDVCGQIASNTLGYNYPDVVGALKDPENLHLLVNRPALGLAPPAEFVSLLKTSLLSVSPRGLNQVMTMMCGSCANENSIKVAFFHYKRLQREQAGIDVTDVEAESTMKNQVPGSPRLSVLSFTGAFHGRTLGCLSLTRSKPVHKLDVPAFDWPVAPFPQLRYPLEENERENRQEEDRCLEQVTDIMKVWSDRNCPVVCICVEPIQAEGGDRHASPYFFQQLQRIAKQSGALFMVDEVQTFGVTGHMWAHEAFGLDESPDIVTFAKKLQVTGAYMKDGLRPDKPYRIFNTWLGDPSKLLVASAVVKVIQRDNLLQMTRKAGEVLLAGLKELQAKYPFLSAARGAGTFCAVDCDSTLRQASLLQALLNKGAYTIGCGEKTIRLRPSLTFQPHHANIFLNIFESVLSEQSH